MLNRILRATKSEYIRHILTIVTGTMLAQFLPLLITPLLTRLYSPEYFGFFGNFIAITAMLSSIISFRLEMAILLPKSVWLARFLASQIIKLVIANGLILLIIGIALLPIIQSKIPQFELYWLILIPLMSVLTALYQVLTYTLNREKSYFILARNRVIQSILICGAQLGLFYIIGNSGLIWGQIFGLLISVLLLFVLIYKQRLFNFKTNSKVSKILLLKYKKFPLIDVPTTLLNSGAAQLPNILFLSFFNPSVAGAYYLTQRVLQAPVSLVSGSILEVFKEQAASEYRTLGNARQTFIKTFKLLLIISIFPSIVLFFSIEHIFVFFFGNEWQQAASFAKMLIPAMAIRFITNPLSFMIYIAQKQIINLQGMSLLATLTVASFYLGDSPLQVVQFISISYVIIYCLYLFISAHIAGVFQKNEIVN